MTRSNQNFLKKSDNIPKNNLASSKNGFIQTRFSFGKTFRKMISWRKLLRKELKSHIKTSISQKLEMYRHGFLSESYIIYQLQKNDCRKYLSDYDRFVKTPAINRSYHIILDNKLVFRTFMQPYKRFLPKDYGIIENNNFYPLDGSIDLLNIDQIVDQRKKLVLKPVAGGGGDGIFIVRKSGDRISINDGQKSKSEFNDFLSSLNNYLVTGFVEQADYSKKIYARTTNTVRVLIVWDIDERKPFIASAVQRIGTSQSHPVDNWTQGGLSARVDTESGELGAGVTYPSSGRLVWHDQHPETEQQIAGIKIPNWFEIKNQLLSIATSFPYLQYVGWDLIITDRSFKIIEGNHYTDVNLLQVHQPLLADPRIRKFYQYHNIII